MASEIIINGITDIYAGSYYVDAFPFDNDIRLNRFKAILKTNRPGIFKMIFEISLLSDHKKYKLDHLVFFEILIGPNRLYIKEIQDIDETDSGTFTEFTKNTSFYEWITVNDYLNINVNDPPKIASGFHDISFGFAE